MKYICHTDIWTMARGKGDERKTFSWTKGKQYDVSFSEAGISLESDEDTGFVSWGTINPGLMWETFGIDVNKKRIIYNAQEVMPCQ